MVHPDEAKALRSLSVVWGKQPQEGYGFLPWKTWENSEGVWHPGEAHNGEVSALPNGGLDVYFTPNRFSQKERTKEHALSSRWLFADLDPVDPRDLELKPTISWETSPGSFQAVWLLAKPLDPEEWEVLNRALVLKLGADKAVWDRSHVLRLPGTISHKHEEPFRVALLPEQHQRPIYTTEEVHKFIGPVKRRQQGAEAPFEISDREPADILRGVRLPVEARELLEATDTNGRDRSAVLWGLGKDLTRAGRDDGEVVTVLRGTVWNKYAQRRDELQRLCAGVLKARVEVEAEQTLSPLSPHISHRPRQMHEDAFHGLAGRIVRTIEPHTEADPVAILLQFLVGVGNAAGRHARFRVEDDHHYANLFVCLVGETSKGRKGVSLRRSQRPLALASPEWAHRCVTNGGLQSGEGLIHHVRDPRMGMNDKGALVVKDEGVVDKRKLIVESEFASPLRRMAREGNTLTTVLREAWDTGRLTNLTRNPEQATNAHISIIAHTTRDELKRELTDVDAANGFANRFLFASVERSKLLPNGGENVDAALKPYVDKLGVALRRAAKRREPMTRDAQADALWLEVYGELSEGKRGMLGAITGRAEAQVLRLSLVYAFLGGSSQIKKDHLKAALAVWDYCEQSAHYIFATATGNSIADRILEALQHVGTEGLDRTQLNSLFSHHVNTRDITEALSLLDSVGVATCEKEATGGRPKERWYATSEISEVSGESPRTEEL